MKQALSLAAALFGAACLPSAPPGAALAVPATAAADSIALVPAGFGSLKQDDIAVRVAQFGLRVRAIPLDESVIRVLSPDSYAALSDLLKSQTERLTELSRRTALPRLSVWYVSFFSQEVGEARYSPLELIITNVGRDFRPVDVIGLSPGFGLQRVRQREVQSALYVFDGQLDVNQPLVIAYETARATTWPAILQRIERERALVRSRAGARS
ncbi:MAG: hypothetical protein IPK85_14410 [Gemmatimonadetes bacterium]|nr:hypothetical protein [Gemmatimonadota bacterium]